MLNCLKTNGERIDLYMSRGVYYNSPSVKQKLEFGLWSIFQQQTIRLKLLDDFLYLNLMERYNQYLLPYSFHSHERDLFGTLIYFKAHGQYTIDIEALWTSLV